MIIHLMNYPQCIFHIYDTINFNLLYSIEFYDFYYCFAKFLSNDNIIVTHLSDSILENYNNYLIKIQNNGFIKEKIFPKFRIKLVTEIPKNKHIMFGMEENFIIKINIYDYNFHKILY